jgi:hypothetical protein
MFVSFYNIISKVFITMLPVVEFIQTFGIRFPDLFGRLDHFIVKNKIKVFSEMVYLT